MGLLALKFIHEKYKEGLSMATYIWFENYNGGVNNLTVIKTGSIVTTSTKGKETALKNHNRKLRKVGLSE